MRWATAALCGYELASITAGRTPTLTEFCRRYPHLRIVLLGALGVHLYRKAA